MPLYQGFGVEKGESTSRKEFFKLTKCNRLYVLETNYWGETFTLKQLKARKLVKDNLRVVKNFGRFYSLEKFAEIGTNLAKSIISAGMVEILRQDKLYQKQIKVFDRELNQMFKLLSSKSERRKLKKLIKKQAEKYNHTELFNNDASLIQKAPTGSTKVNDSGNIRSRLPKNRSTAFPRSDSHEYEEELLLNEEEKLHQEESFKGQDPIR